MRRRVESLVTRHLDHRVPGYAIASGLINGAPSWELSPAGRNPCVARGEGGWAGSIRLRGGRRDRQNLGVDWRAPDEDNPRIHIR